MFFCDILGRIIISLENWFVSIDKLETDLAGCMIFPIDIMRYVDRRFMAKLRFMMSLNVLFVTWNIVFIFYMTYV